MRGVVLASLLGELPHQAEHVLARQVRKRRRAHRRAVEDGAEGVHGAGGLHAAHQQLRWMRDGWSTCLRLLKCRVARPPTKNNTARVLRARRSSSEKEKDAAMHGSPFSTRRPSDGTLRANAKPVTKRPRVASSRTRASMSIKSRWPIAGFGAGSSRRRLRTAALAPLASALPNALQSRRNSLQALRTCALYLPNVL